VGQVGCHGRESAPKKNQHDDFWHLHRMIGAATQQVCVVADVDADVDDDCDDGDWVVVLVWALAFVSECRPLHQIPHLHKLQRPHAYSHAHGSYEQVGCHEMHHGEVEREREDALEFEGWIDPSRVSPSIRQRVDREFAIDHIEKLHVAAVVHAGQSPVFAAFCQSPGRAGFLLS